MIQVTLENSRNIITVIKYKDGKEFIFMKKWVKIVCSNGNVHCYPRRLVCVIEMIRDTGDKPLDEPSKKDTLRWDN